MWHSAYQYQMSLKLEQSLSKAKSLSYKARKYWAMVSSPQALHAANGHDTPDQEDRSQQKCQWFTKAKKEVASASTSLQVWRKGR